MRIRELTEAYKEIEFVCVNPDYCDATDPAMQKALYLDLQQVEGVIPLKQDWDEGQISLTAIYKDPEVKKDILALAKKYDVKIDLTQPVSDDYVDKAIRGEHEGQTKELELTGSKQSGAIVANVKVHGEEVGNYQYKDGRHLAEILPGFRGKGYGAMLLLKVLDIAADNNISVEQDDSTTEAYRTLLDTLESKSHIIIDGDYLYITDIGASWLKNKETEV